MEKVVPQFEWNFNRPFRKMKTAENKEQLELADEMAKVGIYAGILLKKRQTV